MSELNHRKASGTAFVTGPWGERFEGATLSCCHCQFTWVLQKGSGKVRGFCTSCMRPHCGGPNCWECVPIEQRLENIEAGRPELTPAPVKVFVPSGAAAPFC